MKKLAFLLLSLVVVTVVVTEWVFFDRNNLQKDTIIIVSEITENVPEVVTKNVGVVKRAPPPPPPPPPLLNLKPTLTGLSPATVPLLPTPPTTSSNAWTTTYDPTTMSPMCYVKVSNICISNGELIFYYPKSIIKNYKPVFYKGGTKNTLVPAQTSKNKGNIGLCNEGIRKGSPDVQFRIDKERSTPPEGWEVVGDRELNVLHCWEYVGYHLWYCLIGIYLRYSRHSGTFNTTTKEIAMTTVSGMGDTIRLGSPSSWNDTSRGTRPRDNSKYWPLWQFVTTSPSQLWVLYDRRKPICFKSAILGSPNPYSVTVGEWRDFLEEFKNQMRLPVRKLQDRSPSEYKILLIERKNSYKILNVQELLSALTEISPNTRLVMWEDMGVAEQLQIAVDSDIVIGTHGNGLTWSALIPYGGALIELWPGEPYNGNYATISNKTGLHFYQLAHGKNQKRKTRFDYHADIPSIKDTVSNAIQTMQVTDPDSISP